MGMISPGQENFSESFSTLKFAHRTKKIKNKPKINEEMDQETLLKEYEKELKRLKHILSQKHKGAMANSQMKELEQARLRAEKDKDQVIQQLREQSQRFLEEREEKRNLKIRIDQLEKQVGVYQKMRNQFRGQSCKNLFFRKKILRF